MSDFTSGFWNWYVIVLTFGSIGYCAWLLWVTGRMRVKAGQAAPSDSSGSGGGNVELTGHTWDGDLAEYNNPLPRWWMWLFWITIVFALGYLVAYPGLGSFNGLLGWSSTGAWTQETDAADAQLKPMYEKFAGLELPAIAADPAARAMGERIFLVNCAPCHGSDAGGAPGFPNLRDNDWLYGGEPATILASVTNGRMGVMPAFGTALGADGVKNVVAYVRSLSKLPSDGLRAQLGKPLFDQNCAACHGPEGKGNQALGAPNLSDAIWLYGSSEAAIAQGVTNGRHLGMTAEHSPMPAFGKTLGQGPLGPAKINLVAGYVWSLSNKPPATK
jgi:cytochrome c oxidase cbb3-type subunit 3